METPVAAHAPTVVPPVALAASVDVHKVLEGAVNVLVMMSLVLGCLLHR